jgi:hypothetical protein
MNRMVALFAAPQKRQVAGEKPQSRGSVSFGGSNGLVCLWSYGAERVTEYHLNSGASAKTRLSRRRSPALRRSRTPAPRPPSSRACTTQVNSETRQGLLRPQRTGQNRTPQQRQSCIRASVTKSRRSGRLRRRLFAAPPLPGRVVGSADRRGGDGRHEPRALTDRGARSPSTRCGPSPRERLGAGELEALRGVGPGRGTR